MHFIAKLNERKKKKEREREREREREQCLYIMISIIGTLRWALQGTSIQEKNKAHQNINFTAKANFYVGIWWHKYKTENFI